MFRFFKKWLPARDEVRKPMRFVRQSVAMIRREYQGEPLIERNLDTDPLNQFEHWFEEAVAKIANDPNAMVLATVDERGRPSTRTVLMKGFDEHGFVFYTNYNSRKGRNIQANAHVSLTFHWSDLMRQIHIEGTAQKLPGSQSDVYFRSRPVASRISATASPQSQVVASREDLEALVREVQESYDEADLKRPTHWGGYLVVPDRIEFWQGRINRLHDRIVYVREEHSGLWRVERLAP